MRENIRQLKTSDITSDVFVIAPTQLDYIATIFGDAVADAMNMRTFAQKFRDIARASLHEGLRAARRQGAK